VVTVHGDINICTEDFCPTGADLRRKECFDCGFALLSQSRILAQGDKPFGFRRWLSFDILSEHFFRVDGDEDAAAAGEDFIFLIKDFGGIDVFAAADFDFASFDAQGFVQRDGLEIFDCHLAGERDDMVELVDFAHGVIEDARDNPAVAVAGWSGVAVGEIKVADEGLAFFVEDELELHAFGIVLAAHEAVVLLHFHVAGFVALGLGGHDRDFSG
jgi:hypothetical protein